ncbi:MAG TPA: sigma-70 family RNA polymerase sigma factor [Pirellulaceae bacterium]|nr:sigma-70 family RNA polymerase sigma factor [Pirellulaceae bacterium]HMO93095.1 sigma-70 family RNA polymerase sigma factor [Pirellulaceae bacterium]HMP69954.1 sigma-70 family RNA polymerase sigma factor [Pirellulaceae bacterium]
MSEQFGKHSTDVDRLLVENIRNGDSDAWSSLIARYEGRLLAFVESRLTNRSASEDIVQETFIGFLNSLPNFDGARSLESYLFSICSYKITDYLRHEGRRPAIPLSVGEDTSGAWQLDANARAASSIARSGERKKIEETALHEAMQEQVARWIERGDLLKLKVIELLIVRGLANKEVADILEISEQQVANFKFDFLSRTRTLIKRQGLSADVFPELYEAD